MKKTNAISRTIVKSILIFSLIITTLSCSSDDDNNNDVPGAGVALPADKLITYTGILDYIPSSGSQITNLTGTAKITGSSSNYTISFSDNVPNISNIKFALIDGEYVYVNPDDVSEGIIIDEDNELTVDMTINGNKTEFTSISL